MDYGSIGGHTNDLAWLPSITFLYRLAKFALTDSNRANANAAPLRWLDSIADLKMESSF